MSVSLKLFPVLLFGLCLGCNGSGGGELIDLSVRLSPGEVRAGWVRDSSALFGGISAEGRVGDLKMYNDRVQFLIQGTRSGHFYVDHGGGIVDADIVRGEGEQGADFVDDWAPMIGFGRLTDPSRIEVLSHGLNGEPAVVRVVGKEVAMELITGATESPDLIPDLGLEMITTYTLRPGATWLEVTTEVTATEQPVTMTIGDVLLASQDDASLWDPGAGYSAPASGERRFTAYTRNDGEGALAIVPPSGENADMGSLKLLAELAQLAAAVGESVTVGVGERVSRTRYYAAGRDIAQITDAVSELDGEETTVLEDVVQAADGPVAGARVTVLVDSLPWTQAITRPDGSFSANVPAQGTIEIRVDGRGSAIQRDLPDGVGQFSPYATATVTEATLNSIAKGADGNPMARGRGISEDTTLAVPATLTLRAGDSLPFEARIFRVDGPSLDRSIFPARFSGEGILTWAHDGEVNVSLEPGEYAVMAHRGLRFERGDAVVTLESGQAATLDFSMPQAYEHPGWLLGDPHAHSAPSSDASISMMDRLIVAAGVGLQLHFGTDHDHVADYRPLLEPLGLDDVLMSVVADEVSPPMRGHINVYPAVQKDLPNGGAWRWWMNPVQSTDEQMSILRSHYGSEIRMQANHPLDSGIGSSAGWSPGEIARPDFWSENFDAVEVMNAAEYRDYLDFFIDVSARGHRLTPVGVSDSHSHTGGSVGLSATFFGMGVDTVAQYSDEKLVEVMDSARTIVSRGPFLDLSLDPGSTVVGPVTLEVAALAPSWIVVDRLLLLENGVEVERLENSEGTFTLSPEQDAQYVVIAEGDTPMGGVWSGRTPWAMASPIYVDAEGDGWVSTLAPLAFD